MKRRRGKARICVSILSQSFSLSLSLILMFVQVVVVCFCVTIMRLCNFAVFVSPTILVMDSCCRGGIVNIRVGCSRALVVRRHSPTALWRFRASTSNSLSGRSRPHTHTPVVIFIILTLDKIFEYMKMTISAAQAAVAQSQGALTSSRKYLSTSR